MSTMKAVVKTRPQPGAELKQVSIPKIKPNEVLVKVRASSICGTDMHIFRWDDWAKNRIRPPLTIGHEVCGDVVEIGSNVQSIQKGDYISAESHVVCGTCYQCRTGNAHICQNTKILGIDRDGTFAEYVAIPENCAWKNHKKLPPEIATMLEPFGNSVHAVMEHNVSAKSIAIFGAGPTGLFAVAVAKACGAYPIIVSEINDYRLKLAKKVGADCLIKADKNDAVKDIYDITNGVGADVVLVMSGAQIAYHQGFKALSFGGRITMFGIPSKEVSIDISNDIIFKGAKVFGVVGRKVFTTWYMAQKLISSGKVNLEPILTHTFKLDDYQKAVDIMNSTNCGKVVLLPK